MVGPRIISILLFELSLLRLWKARRSPGSFSPDFNTLVRAFTFATIYAKPRMLSSLKISILLFELSLLRLYRCQHHHRSKPFDFNTLVRAFTFATMERIWAYSWKSLWFQYSCSSFHFCDSFFFSSLISAGPPYFNTLVRAFTFATNKSKNWEEHRTYAFQYSCSSFHFCDSIHLNQKGPEGNSISILLFELSLLRQITNNKYSIKTIEKFQYSCSSFHFCDIKITDQSTNHSISISILLFELSLLRRKL